MATTVVNSSVLLKLVVGLPLAAFIWLATKASRAERAADHAVEIGRGLRLRLDRLEHELQLLRRPVDTQPPAAAGPAPVAPPTPVVAPAVVAPQPLVMPEPVRSSPVVVPPPPPAAAPLPPPPIIPPVRQPAPVIPPVSPRPAGQVPGPAPARPIGRGEVWDDELEAVRKPSPGPARPAINWEQFMGVKLFAWIGGFALFLGLVFFLKYAFENKLISPEFQVAGEYLVAIGVLAGGIVMKRKPLAVLMQTLCATGVLMLYAVTFAGRSYYNLIPVPVAFGVMALVTAAAFLLAVRLEAPVVAVLGLVGGFLTPILLSTGVDNPLGLFTYIALLDLGLIAVALHRRWTYLVMLGAIGTVVLQVGWVGEFFTPAKIVIALAVFLGFEALFLGALLLARRRGQADAWLGAAGAALGLVPFWCTLFLLHQPALADRPWHIFALVLAADAGLVLLVRQTGWKPLVIVAALGTALAQFLWLAHHFVATHWATALGLAVVFEALFGLALLLVRRRSRGDESTGDWFAGAAAGMAAMPFWFALYLLGHPAVGGRLEIYFAFVVAGVVGWLCLALRTRWTWLALAAAVATAVLGAIWLDKYFAVAKTLGAMGLALGFDALFLVAFALAQRWKRADGFVTGAVVAQAFLPVAFALYLLGYRDVVADQPTLFFGYLFVADLAFVALVLQRLTLARVQMAAGGAVFLVLAIWTGKFVSESLLYWSLGMNLLFAALHAVFPVVLKRRLPAALGAGWWQLFPLLSLALVTFPILRMPSVSWVVWLAVLLLDGVIFVLALLASAVLAMIGAIVFTLGLAALWILRVPVIGPPLPALLLVIGGFALFFFVVSLLVARKLGTPGAPGPAIPEGWGLPAAWVVPENLQVQLPSLGAVLPFALLMMVLARLTLASPGPVFGLALLLVVLLLGVVRAARADLLGAVALGCTGLLEWIWLSRAREMALDQAVVTVGWNLVFYAVFTLFPFVFRTRLQDRVLPWAVAALAGPLHLWLIYGPVKIAWPGLVPVMGLVPAAFALPALAGLLVLLRRLPAALPTRLALLALFGGVTLFFVTVIFPVQFERQWITVAWALEGAALLWLFQRVPHNGLRLVGVGLLIASFVRLGLNPAVLAYHVRSTTPILNWYLYTYGITTVCLFAGTRLLAPPRNIVFGSNAPVLLATLGTVLAFLLLNIEIADYFTAPGTGTLTFQFEGNFTRDMTYSIAWALFGLTLLTVGIAKKLPAVRYASLALIGVTLLKLFLHDLRELGQLQRIGAFVGVAVILLVSSFLYQRFVPAETKPQ